MFGPLWGGSRTNIGRRGLLFSAVWPPGVAGTDDDQASQTTSLHYGLQECPEFQVWVMPSYSLSALIGKDSCSKERLQVLKFVEHFVEHNGTRLCSHMCIHKSFPQPTQRQ